MTSNHSEVMHRTKAFHDKYPLAQISSLQKHPLLNDFKNDPIHAIALRNNSSAVTPLQLELFVAVRNLNRNMLETIEGTPGCAEIKSWNKTGPNGDAQGGGTMSTLRGKIVEKAACQMSVVWGPSYPSIEQDHSGKPFTAMGVSFICHPYNPYGPIAHMNVRVLKVGEGADAITWIGGGADLTPMIPFAEDTADFHNVLKKACQDNRLGDYEKYTKWCDEYFFIPHRGETRGVGGIFFDYVKPSQDSDFQILLDVAQGFAHTYADILARRVYTPFDDITKDKHLYWRGRYAEFNLVHDRGTRFGLMSGGNIEAIFGSLPPVVKW